MHFLRQWAFPQREPLQARLSHITTMMNCRFTEFAYKKSSLAEVYTAYHRRLFMHGRLKRYQYIFSVFSGFHSSILTLIHIPSEFLIAKMHWFCNKALMTSSVKFCIYTNHGRVSQWTICISSSVASLSERISFWNLYTLSDLLAFHEFHRSLQWYGVKLQRI